MANELPHRNGPIPAVNLPFEPQQIGVKGCNRYDRQQRGLLIQKTIDDMDREVTERPQVTELHARGQYRQHIFGGRGFMHGRIVRVHALPSVLHRPRHLPL